MTSIKGDNEYAESSRKFHQDIADEEDTVKAVTRAKPSTVTVPSTSRKKKTTKVVPKENEAGESGEETVLTTNTSSNRKLRLADLHKTGRKMLEEQALMKFRDPPKGGNPR